MFSPFKRTRHIELEGPIDPLAELVHALLHGIHSNSLRLEGPAAEELCTRMFDIEKRISEDHTDAKTGELYASWAAKAFANYTEIVDRDPQARRADWTPLVLQLADTIRTLCSPSDLAEEHLREFQQRFATAHSAAEFAALRKQTAVALQEIVSQAAQQHREILGLMTRAKLEIPPYFRLSSLLCNDETDLPYSLDAVTALPDRFSAELALSAAADAGNTHAVLLPVDRLSIFRARFGAEAADSTMLFFAQHAKSNLRPSDQLFRWNQNALLLIFKREATPEALRSEIATIAGHKLEHTVEQAGRQSLITVTSRWSVFELQPKVLTEPLIRRIDTAVDAPTGMR